MMFRRLYWVTEVSEAGNVRVAGVYTSIPDLIEKGLENGAVTRISLVKLDSCDGPLGRWESPSFGNMREDLQAYVATGEFALDEIQSLAMAISGLAGIKA
ncbi:MAG: hypothetical protein HONBIEJF_01467 [Fimbriimonadaceae bacterium]|nr:hypothetical protein [Fimbriimonadaceae bacterium]